MNNLPLYCVLLIFTLITILILYTKTQVKNKVIWTYWHDPDNVPELIKISVKSWIKCNHGYKVVILSKKNYKDYVSIPDNIVNNKNFNDSHARFSDLIRLYVLAENGGIWIDASTLLSKKLNLNLKKYEFSGYYLEGFTDNNKNYPVIESWFLACRKDSNFIKKWRDEFSEMSKFDSVKDYVNSRKELGVDFQKIDGHEYLAIHISAQKVLQIDKYPISKLELKKAEDGPYKYLYTNEWNIEKGVRSIVKNDYDFIKIRGAERSFIDGDKELKDKIYKKYKV